MSETFPVDDDNDLDKFANKAPEEFCGEGVEAASEGLAITRYGSVRGGAVPVRNPGF